MQSCDVKLQGEEHLLLSYTIVTIPALISWALLYTVILNLNDTWFGIVLKRVPEGEVLHLDPLLLQAAPYSPVCQLNLLAQFHLNSSFLRIYRRSE
jgi:hypothetical protein